MPDEHFPAQTAPALGGGLRLVEVAAAQLAGTSASAADRQTPIGVTYRLSAGSCVCAFSCVKRLPSC